MISKLLHLGATLEPGAIAGMGRALEDFAIEGVATNLPFLAAVMDQARFQSGELSTNYIKDEFPDGFDGTAPTAFQTDAMTAVAAYMHRTLAARARRDRPTTPCRPADAQRLGGRRRPRPSAPSPCWMRTMAWRSSCRRKSAASG